MTFENPHDLKNNAYKRKAKKCLQKTCSVKFLKKRLPIVNWLPKYKFEFFIQDVIAGITVALTAIPQGIAYAVIAGLPPEYGLYASLTAGLVYVFFGSCHNVTVGPTAILSAMTARYVSNYSADFAILVAFLSGVFIFILGILNLGFLVEFISIPVISGFTTAAALQIAASQLKSYFGLEGISGNYFAESMENFFNNITTVKIWEVVLSTVTVIVLLLLKKMGQGCSRTDGFAKQLRWFVSLSRNAVVVIMGIIIAYVLKVSLDAEPIAIIGDIGNGLPKFSWPPFNTVVGNQTYTFYDILEVLGPESVVVPFVAIIESVAIAKAFAVGAESQSEIKSKTLRSKTKKFVKKAFSMNLVRRRLPITNWLPKYRAEYITQDVVAGITVGLTAIPQGIAYAVIAGLAPEYGLYASLTSGVIYMFFGSCYNVTVGPTAILATLVAKCVSNYSVDFAILTTFLSGMLMFVMGIFNLGFLVDFISMPVIRGFTIAAALQIIAGQLKPFFGLKGSSGHCFGESMQNLFANIRTIQLWETVLGAGTVISLMLLQKMGQGCKQTDGFVKQTRWFVSLLRNAIVVIIGMIIAYILKVTTDTEPLALIGDIGSGFPKFSWPPFSTQVGEEVYGFRDMLSALGAQSLMVPFVAILETVAVAKAFAAGGRIDATQELIAVGLCNIVGSFGQSMPITGSFTRTTLNHDSGVKTPAGGVIKYKAEYFIQDVIAGITVGLTAIPQGIAYAVIAGLTPEYGLYASLTSGVVYVVFGSCYNVTVGPTAILAAMVAKYVSNYSADFAILTAFLSGVFMFLIGIFNLGFLVEFISMPVISGFTTAAALQIIAVQLKSFLGLKGPSGNYFAESMQNLFANITTIQLWETVLGAGTVIMLMLLQKMGHGCKRTDGFVKQTRWFISMSRNAVVVVIGMIITYILKVTTDTEPLAIIGDIGSGLPKFSWPPFSTLVGEEAYSFRDMLSVLGVQSVMVPFVAILETVAIAKAFAAGGRIDATQELIAVGLCNIIGSFGQSMPITGSFARTALNHVSGVKTPAGGVTKLNMFDKEL
ncbi:unnamed protein product [Chrysodeixis includens]|uniref:SLC26A/SulP transporter domain-containing protein n=1 Tax=Chrysodeixis includens TaxID=689277 RepID=A0A9N8KZM0_CHRIL|nr:unnamed protein product [Chrysodeixis includens]